MKILNLRTAVIATMCSCHEAAGGEAGVARPLGKLAGEDLDIVSAPECSGGPSSGDHHGQYPSISIYPQSLARQGTAREEGACAIAGTRHQVAAIQGTGLTHAVLADPVTMWRLRRSRSLAAIGAGAVCAVPSAHSCDLHIGVGSTHSPKWKAAVRPKFVSSDR